MNTPPTPSTDAELDDAMTALRRAVARVNALRGVEPFPPVQPAPTAAEAALEPGARLIPADAIADAIVKAQTDGPAYYLLLPVTDSDLDEEAFQNLLPDDATVVCSGCGADVRVGDSAVNLGGSWECDRCRSAQTPDADRHDR